MINSLPKSLLRYLMKTLNPTRTSFVLMLSAQEFSLFMMDRLKFHTKKMSTFFWSTIKEATLEIRALSFRLEISTSISQSKEMFRQEFTVYRKSILWISSIISQISSKSYKFVLLEGITTSDSSKPNNFVCLTFEP